MRTVATLGLAIWLAGVLPVTPQPGDANCDAVVDLDDVAALITALFLGSDCPTVDVNDDARLAVADLSALLFLVSPSPAVATATSTPVLLPTSTPPRTATRITPSPVVTVPPATRTPTDPPPTVPSTPATTHTAAPTSAPTALQPLFSSYIAGNGDDFIRDVVTDADGNIYLTGGTASSDFPTTTGAYDRTHNGWMDVFVAKLAPTGSLVWSTLLGGPNYDRAYGIELDPQGNVVVGGRAGPGFPTTAGVVQPGFAGDDDPINLYGLQDGFAAKVSADGGQLLWATYFGGADRAALRDIAVDDVGSVYLALTGVTRPFPYITVGAYQTALRGAPGGVIGKLSSDGADVIWATHFDGTGLNFGTPSIRVDAAHDVYVLSDSTSPNSPTTPNAYATKPFASFDLHLGKLSADGRRLLYGTYLGGSANEFTETHGLAIDANGRAVVAITTRSTDLMTTPGAYQRSYGGNGTDGTGGGTNYSGDGYVALVAADGTQLLAATYLGGSFGEGIEGVSVDTDGRVYVSGATFSTNFPVSADASQRANNGKSDFFLVVLSADLRTLVYGSYFGGQAADEGRSSTIDASGRMIVVGHTVSSDWPLASPLQSTRKSGQDGALAVFPALQHSM